MDIFEQNPLQDCPYCGGAGVLEEENGWCWYAVCMDCGAQTGQYPYDAPERRAEAARMAAHTWNIGKILRGNPGE